MQRASCALLAHNLGLREESPSQDEPSEAKEPADCGPRPITEEQWNTVVIPDEGVPLTLQLTVHRHAEYHKTLELAAPLTLRALLSAMGNFYQHPLTPEEIEEVRDRVPEAMFGYKWVRLGDSLLAQGTSLNLRTLLPCGGCACGAASCGTDG